MRVLCEYSPGGSVPVRSGWGHVMKACGHDFRFWIPERKSAMDAFSEFKPELAVLTTYGFDRALDKCVRADPAMKVAMFASAWGDLVDGLDRTRYPVVYVTDGEKRRLSLLKEQTGKPDFVFVHVTDRYLEPTMGGWRSIGIEPVGILNACNTFLYSAPTPRPELACDAAMVGGWWGYKAANLKPYVLPLCHPSEGLNVKLFGHSPWPVANYLGGIDVADERDLYASATVCLSVSEPHSTDLGFDCIERLFKVPGAGGFLVTDHVDEYRGLFGEDEVVSARSPGEFHDLVRHYARHPDERLPFVEKARAKALAEHTYWERVEKMFSSFGLAEEAAHVARTKRKFVNAEAKP